MLMKEKWYFLACQRNYLVKNMTRHLKTNKHRNNAAETRLLLTDSSTTYVWILENRLIYLPILSKNRILI